jgi:hypothetical protein
MASVGQVFANPIPGEQIAFQQTSATTAGQLPAAAGLAGQATRPGRPLSARTAEGGLTAQTVLATTAA